jgi:hypothetical protein
MGSNIKMQPNSKVTNDLLVNQEHANSIIVYNYDILNEVVNMQVIENSALLTEFRSDKQIGVWKQKEKNNPEK